jgi:hypothetical protein
MFPMITNKGLRGDTMTGLTRLLPKEAADYVGCGYDKLMQMVRRGDPTLSDRQARIFHKRKVDPLD